MSVETPRAPAPLARSRWPYLAVGGVSLALAVAGAFLPVLPTTPLALLAAWAFGRSSPRLEAWLLRHPWFGESIARWRAHRVVPLSAKRAAWSAMAITFALSVAAGLPAWALAAQALLMGYGAWFIARCPSRDSGDAAAPTTAAPPSAPDASECG